MLVNNSEFFNNSNRGIAVNGKNIIINNVKAYNNDGVQGGLYMLSFAQHVTINNSQFFNNTTYGISLNS